MEFQDCIQFKKWAEDLKSIFPKKTYRGPTATLKDAQPHESSGEANQNHNVISSHTCQESYCGKKKKKKKNNKNGKDVGKKGTLEQCCWECKLV